MKVRQKVTSWLLSAAVACTLMGTVSIPVYAEGQEPTLITTAEQFAAMEANGNYKLGADITVTTPYENDFSGSFDGAGHTITLDINSSTRDTGLFKGLASGAIISNIITDGAVSSSNSKGEVGAIAGCADGTPDPDDVDKDDIVIENCINKANVTGKKIVGGIVGYPSGNVTIKSCANLGNVKCEGMYSGGIAGQVYSSQSSTHVVKILYCYNTGAVEATTGYVGGILGNAGQYSREILRNCYNIGKCSKENEYNPLGLLLGCGSSKKVGGNESLREVISCYVLKDGENVAIGKNEKASDKVTIVDKSEEMKTSSFLTALNNGGDAFIASNPSYNNGFPILKFEKDAADAAGVVYEAVAGVKARFDGESALVPVSGTDSDIIEMVANKVKAYGITGAENIEVILKSSDNDEVISDEAGEAFGKINFNKGDIDPNGNARTANCVFTFKIGEVTVDSDSKAVVAGWDKEYVDSKITEEAAAVTFDKIKGANTSQNEISKDLVLPSFIGGSAEASWTTLTWTSSDNSLVRVDGNKGVVTSPVKDTKVKLTASYQVNPAILSNTAKEKTSSFAKGTKEIVLTVKGTGEKETEDKSIKSITLDKTAAVAKGKKITLKPVISPKNADTKGLKWSSSKEAIATVTQKGVVTGKKEGTAKITVTSADGKVKATCTVTVKKANAKIAVTKVTLNSKSGTLQAGKKLTLKATVYPSNASDKKVTWSSSKASVATVKNGVVTAKKAGKTVITVKTHNGGKTAKYNLTVKAKPVVLKSLKLNKKSISLSLKNKKSATLTVTPNPKAASTKGVKWNSDKPGIVSVKNGKLTAKKTGTANITVSVGKISAKCKVTVKK